MVNNMLLDILKRKIDSGEVKVENIKSEEYKAEIENYLSSKPSEPEV